MSRHQIFFAGVDPEPILVALILKRTRDASGIFVEAKSFVAWNGQWQTPFWERKRLKRSPGASLAALAGAWQAAAGAAELRLNVQETSHKLKMTLRRKQGGLEIDARGLAPVGTASDPHGAITWRAGSARIKVNGKRFRGKLVVEQLAHATTPWPHFGRFEMWLRGLADGGLLLGRVTIHGVEGKGRALLLPASGKAAVVPFAVASASTREDKDSGFKLPIGWQLGRPIPALMRRAGGEVGRGKAPDGKPAVYDISLAVGDGGPVAGGTALVFHLHDAPQAAKK